MSDIPEMEKQNQPAHNDIAFLLSSDLLLTLAVTVVLIVLIVLGESTWLPDAPVAAQYAVNIPRLVFGMAYVFLVPGYWLTTALFTGKDSADSIERVGLSLGLSVAWVPVLALILDLSPWGLRLWPIMIGEVVSSLIFASISLVRRAEYPLDTVFIPPRFWRPRQRWLALSQFEKTIYLLCAGALLVAAAAAAWVFLVPSPDEFMTEFYILGKEGMAEDYPREAVPGEELTVTMGVRNLERETHSYHVEVWAIDIWDERTEYIAGVDTFTLDVDEVYELPVTWAMPWAGQDQQVEFRLFSDIQSNTETEPYRLLRLWLNVSEP